MKKMGKGHGKKKAGGKSKLDHGHHNYTKGRRQGGPFGK